jgi:hypothetical protein
MGAEKWNKVIKFLNSRPKATPEKVLNILRTTYGKRSGPESDYEVLRNSWAWIVVGAIANKTGTPKDDKKRSTRNIIRNWVKTKQFKNDWCMFHPKKVKNKKLNKIEWNESSEKDCDEIHPLRHLKQINDIWVSKIGKNIRTHLTPSGKFPVSSQFFKNYKRIVSGE